jgi:hypothetical protein
MSRLSLDGGVAALGRELIFSTLIRELAITFRRFHKEPD